MGASAGVIALAAGVMGVAGVGGTLGGSLVASADGGEGRSSVAGGGGGVVPSREVTRAAPKSGKVASGSAGNAWWKADGPSRHTDRKAVEYFRDQWGAADEATSRIKDIRTVGRYLRIYTSLSETAGNSSQAIALCERGLTYLKANGVKDPVVFVQARFGENGNPVLANILGPSDSSCRVTHPAPN